MKSKVFLGPERSAHKCVLYALRPAYIGRVFVILEVRLTSEEPGAR